MQRKINIEKHITTITPIETPIFLGMETLGKTQDGKTGAAVGEEIYHEDIEQIQSRRLIYPTWQNRTSANH